MEPNWGLNLRKNLLMLSNKGFIITILVDNTHLKVKIYCLLAGHLINYWHMMLVIKLMKVKLREYVNY